MQSSDDDRDVLTWQEVSEQASWWLNLIKKLFQFGWDVLTRHWRFSLPCMVLLGAFGIFILYSKAKTYTVTTTFVYEELHPKIFGDMVGKLNSLLSFGQLEKAAQLLQMDTTQMEKIINIQVTDSHGRSLANNYAFRQEPMVITIRLSDLIDEDSLRHGITHYLNSNPFPADRLELKKRLLTEEKDFIETKLETIDSVMANLYTGKQKPASDQSNITIETAEGKNAYELLQFSRELMKRRSEVENHLARPENVIAIDNFLILPKAQLGTGSVIKYGIAGGVAGYLLAALLLGLRLLLFPGHKE